MRYFLDTNICIYIMRSASQKVMMRLSQYAPADLGISTIVLSELEYGVAKSTHVDRNRRKLDVFLSAFTIVPYDSAAAQAYGRIRADLQKSGNLIGREDMMIAAHAVAANVTLITNNEREFGRIPALTVENWA